MRLAVLTAVLIAGLAHGIDLGRDLLDYVRDEYGAAARERLTDWEVLINEHQEATEAEQILAANRFFNRRGFVPDIEHWGRRDYWATPVEFLATNAGDCEEFANAKYMTLRAMGIPEEQLRVTYVDAIHLEQAHMVLAYYPRSDSDPLILDNLVDSIQPSSQRTDLRPVYSFNGTDLWLARDERSDRRVGSADEVRQWRHLRNRMLNITGE